MYNTEKLQKGDITYMKKHVLLVAVLIMIVAIGYGCSGTKTVRSSSGEKINIYILSNRGNPEEMTEKQFKWRTDLGQWMEQDLIRLLEGKGGYEASLIQNRNEFRPGPGKYLLTVTIISYNPGSRAARMLVGYGAGATSVNNHYELFGEGNESLLSYDDGVGSSRNWTNVARKLNENALKRVTNKLIEIHGNN